MSALVSSWYFGTKKLKKSIFFSRIFWRNYQICVFGTAEPRKNLKFFEPNVRNFFTSFIKNCRNRETNHFVRFTFEGQLFWNQWKSYQFWKCLLVGRAPENRLPPKKTQQEPIQKSLNQHNRWRRRFCWFSLFSFWSFSQGKSVCVCFWFRKIVLPLKTNLANFAWISLAAWTLKKLFLSPVMHRKCWGIGTFHKQATQKL